MGIETLNDCVSHVSWVNKNIILYHQSPWPWVVPQNCHNQLFSHAEKNNIFCGARLYEFFQVSIQKGLFRIFDSQQSHNRGTPWFLLTLVVILLNGLRQPKKNWLHFFTFPTQWLHGCSSKIHMVPQRPRGLLAKNKTPVAPWYSALQLASEKEACYCQLCLKVS